VGAGARLPPARASPKGSAWCGGGRQSLSGACLPPSRASPRMAPHSVAAAGKPLFGTKVGARLPLSRASPGTAPCGVAAAGFRFPVRASHCRGRVRNGSARCGGGRKALSWKVCRCAPPSVMGESEIGSVRCGGGRQIPFPGPSIDAWRCKPTSFSGGSTRALAKILGESLAQICVWASGGNSFLKASLKNLLLLPPWLARSTPRHEARAKALSSSAWPTMITLRRHLPPWRHR
jgi:hypothetical protein